jgi:hypothetical protein
VALTLGSARARQPIAPAQRRNQSLTRQTNNLLILFTQLYSDSEVLRKVVVIKADKYDWYVRAVIRPSRS